MSAIRNVISDYRYYSGDKPQKRIVMALKQFAAVRDHTTWMSYEDWLRAPHNAPQGGLHLTWSFEETGQTIVGPFTRNNDDSPTTAHVADHDGLADAMRPSSTAARTATPITTFHVYCFHVAEAVLRRLVPQPVLPGGVCAEGLFWFKALLPARGALKGLLTPSGPDPHFLEQLKLTQVPFPLVDDSGAQVDLFSTLNPTVAAEEAYELLRLLVACLHMDERATTQCDRAILVEFARSTPLWTRGVDQVGYVKTIPLGQWAVRPNVSRQHMDDDRLVRKGKPKRKHRSDEDAEE